MNRINEGSTFTLYLEHNSRILLAIAVLEIGAFNYVSVNNKLVCQFDITIRMNSTVAMSNISQMSNLEMIGQCQIF